MMGEWELINVAAAGAVVVRMLRADLIRIYFLLFAYCSLHFTFAAMPMLTGESIENIVNLHIKGGGVLSKAAASSVIVAFLVVIYTKSSVLTKGVGLALAVSLLLLMVGYLLNLRVGDWMQLKNVAATGLVAVMLASMALVQLEFKQPVKERYIAFLIALLVTMLVVAFFEIYTLRTWATFVDSKGVMVRRSSALLFNPNLYGLWSAIVATFFSFLYLRQSGPWALFAMVLAFAGIFFSGSRSAAFLLFFVLVGVALFTEKKSGWIKWMPAALMLAVFFGIALGSNLLSFFSGNHSREGWDAIAVVGERFAIYPIQLAAYLWNHLDWGRKINIPTEIAVSIEGRFIGELKDSGWLVLHDDAGWMGVIAAVCVGFMLGWLGVRTYLLQRDLPSIYALAVLVLVVGLGFVSRFQVFPTGVLMAITLAPCVAYWRSQHSMGLGNA